VKLYDNKMMPSPRRLRIFLAEKGIDVPLVPLDLQAGDLGSAEFARLNPLGEVPVLELDDGTVLTESLALCRYFEALHPEPNLLGRTPLEAAQIEQWTLRLMFRLYVPVTQVFRNTHRFWAGRIAQVPEYGELARKQVQDELARLEAHLVANEFVAAGRFTLADIVAFTAIDFGKPSNLRIDAATQPNLKRWYDSIAARPSARA
jgi:glutathione S-transferase